MSTPATLLVIGSLLPLLAFGLLLFLGRRLGTPLAGYAASVCMAGSFICSLVAMMVWVGAARESAWGMGHEPIHLSRPWLPIGPPGQSIDANSTALLTQASPGYLSIGLYIDSLTICLYSVVALVAALASIFAIGFLADEPGSSRFFLWMSLLCAAMLALVMTQSLLQIFIAWEVMGFASYMLIGFWRAKRSAGRAALKALALLRLGDCGFLIALGIFAACTGTLSLPRLWTTAAMMSPVMQTVAGLALFLAAMTAAAQFPLHAWIADAAEAPAPANALMQAASISAAGVYLLARIYPLLTMHAKLVIAVIGCITLTIGALMAVAQIDLKKVVACAIVSQLGYMMLAMGIGSWVGGLFHLITNAFVGGLLFLAAGSVIHAARGQRDMRKFGGLFARLPVTAICFAIGVLAMAGAGVTTASRAASDRATADQALAPPSPAETAEPAPPSSGFAIGFSEFYSRNQILQDAAAFAATPQLRSRFDPFGPRGRWWLFCLLPSVMAGVTALALMRAWMLTFSGAARDVALAESARERPLLWTPMLFLAGLSAVAGSRWFGVRELLENSLGETGEYCRAIDPAFPGFVSGFSPMPPRVQSPLAAREILQHDFWWIGLAGLALGLLLYVRPAATLRLRSKWPVACIAWFLGQWMYFDWLTRGIIVSVVRGTAWAVAAVDRYALAPLANAPATLSYRAVSRLLCRKGRPARGVS